MVEHARRLADRMMTRDAASMTGSLVVELASNDGYLLQHYVARGIPVLGIEPARNIAEVGDGARASRRSPSFSAPDLAADARASPAGWPTSCTPTTCWRTCPTSTGSSRGSRRSCKPDGVAVIETPYVRDLVERLEFDTIYHEHVFYYSLTSLPGCSATRPGHRRRRADPDPRRIAARLRRPRRGRTAVRPPVAALLADEEASSGVDASSPTSAGSRRASRPCGDRPARPARRHQGARQERSPAYGAAAKGAVLLNAFGIGAGHDRLRGRPEPPQAGPLHAGRRASRSCPPSGSSSRCPTHCLLLAWNFADEILAQQTRVP